MKKHSYLSPDPAGGTDSVGKNGDMYEVSIYKDGVLSIFTILNILWRSERAIRSIVEHGSLKKQIEKCIGKHIFIEL